MQRDDRALTRGWHHSRRPSRSHTLCHTLAHANLLLLNCKIQLLFSSRYFNLTYKYKIVFKLLGFSVEQILNSGVLIGKKKHGIQSYPSCFNLWLWRQLEIASNSLTPAQNWAPTGVSSSISGGWSWRRHRWPGRTPPPFLCFLSDTPLKSLSTSLHFSASFLGL